MLKTKNHKIHINYFIEKRLAYQQPPENREPQAEAAKPAKEAFKEIEEAVKALEKAKGERKELIDRISHLMQNPSTSQYFSAELLTALSRYSELRELIYVHTNTPEKVRVDLLKDPKVRAALITDFDNGRVATATVRGYYDPNPEVRTKARQILNAVPAHIWDKRHPSEKAAALESTPKETLTALANNPDFSVRAAVAANPNTPPAVLTKLATDANSHVHAGIARNPASPPDLLNKLSHDKADRVLISLLYNINTPAIALETIFFADPGKYSALIAHHPNTPPSILGKLAGHKDDDIRKLVARNPNTPQEILWQLISDKDFYVLKALIENPSSPTDLSDLAIEKLRRRNEKK